MTRKRCAIYTRKSTDEGLDQTFNSLDAQREACEAYVTSQRHEGWSRVRKAYDDGGYSGGSMDRPALQLLLKDIQAGLVDVVVVYKIDRLTRALADFAKMVEVFDAKHVSFVSVTQQFNTTTSMGRLTLNVLLSFAQFEREVTAERIRDKISASRKKGMWMGGPPPLGYDVQDKRLVINPDEAEQVRRLFAAYLELRSVKALTAWAAQQGIVSKIRSRPDGSVRSGGRPFSRGNLHALLRYRTYIGEVQHRGNVYPGEQEAIIDRHLWDKVQAQLQTRSSTAAQGERMSFPRATLAGILFDDTGDRLTPTHATKAGRRYLYYVSTRLIAGNSKDPSGWRLPAHKLEQAVCNCVAEFLGDKRVVLDALRQTDALSNLQINQILTKLSQITDSIIQSHISKRLDVIRPLLRKVIVGQGQIQTTVCLDALITQEIKPSNAASTGTPVACNSSSCDLESQGQRFHTITSAFTIQRRGVEAHLILDDSKTSTAHVDANLIRLVAKARLWFEELRSGVAASVNAIAEREHIPASEVSRCLPLAFLAPSIVSAILRGQQPVTVTATQLLRLRDIPMVWTEQVKVLGFSAP